MKPKNDYPEYCKGCKYWGTNLDETLKMEVPSYTGANWKGCKFGEKPSRNVFKMCRRQYEEDIHSQMATSHLDATGFASDRWVEA